MREVTIGTAERRIEDAKPLKEIIRGNLQNKKGAGDESAP
jgi:hypothetical protein